MDKFRVILLPKALKFYRKCPPSFAIKLNRCFESLEENPFFGPHIKVLRGDSSLRRYRVGQYRVIYQINEAKKEVGVLLIAPRGQAYKNL